MIQKYQILKETIVQTIQNSNLDIGIIYFIFKDLYNEVEKQYYFQLNREKAETNKDNEQS